MPADTPEGLGAAGSALWSEIAGQYELRSDECRVLEDAAREADLIARLEAALEGEPSMVTGSTGQRVVHPIFAEVRQHRATLAALLRQLKLPDDASKPEARSTSARAAANARWARRGA